MHGICILCSSVNLLACLLLQAQLWLLAVAAQRNACIDCRSAAGCSSTCAATF